MIQYRLVERPTLDVLGRKTWFAGQDNSLFGRFWVHCAQDELFARRTWLSGRQLRMFAPRASVRRGPDHPNHTGHVTQHPGSTKRSLI
jgi:hypothetical protein